MKKLIGIILCLACVASADEWKLATSFYADRTARAVGDLVTVSIEEQSSVKKDAKSDSDKESSGGVNFNLPGMQANGTAMWDTLQLPAWTLDASKQYSTSGSKESSEAFSASITVYITEVLPNGNLMISGDRVVNIDKDLIKFTLSGMVRPEDIDRTNTILSSRVASASITYETVGQFAKSQRKGIFSRIADWVFPF